MCLQVETSKQEKENENMLVKIAILTTPKTPVGAIAADEEVLISRDVAAKDEWTAVLLTGAEHAHAILAAKPTHTFKIVAQKIA